MLLMDNLLSGQGCSDRSLAMRTFSGSLLGSTELANWGRELLHQTHGGQCLDDDGTHVPPCSHGPDAVRACGSSQSTENRRRSLRCGGLGCRLRSVSVNLKNLAM